MLFLANYTNALTLIPILFSLMGIQTQTDNLVPLSYVRRLAIAPVALGTPPDSRPKPRPPIPAKREYAEWLQQRAERATYVRRPKGESLRAALRMSDPA